MRNDGRVGIGSCPVCEGISCSVDDEGELYCVRGKGKSIQVPVDGVIDEVSQISYLINKYQLMGGGVVPNQLVLGIDVFNKMRPELQVDKDLNHMYQWLSVVVDISRVNVIQVGYVID